MNSFEVALAYMLENETRADKPDEVVKLEHDAGGTTKFGISLRFLRSISPEKLRIYGVYSDDEQTIIDLCMAQAKAIYRGEFWNQAPFGKINTQASASYIFDCAVNLGISPAIKIAQRACWSIMGCRGSLEDDGIMGNHTLDVINQCGTYLIHALRSERAGYYRGIVDRNTAQSVFLEGWLNRAYRR